MIRLSEFLGATYPVGLVDLPAHSPVGGSGAYRWTVCSGSSYYSEGVEDPESEYAATGTAAHYLGERCIRDRIEPWTMMGWAVHNGSSIVPVEYWEDGEVEGERIPVLPGKKGKGHYEEIDRDMVEAVQWYISILGEWHTEGQVELKFHCPSLHKWFYGQSDFVALRRRVLDIWDYKHGAGIVVEAEGCPQLMYYAAGVLEQLNLWNDVDVIRLHIAQPRAYHWQGPHRYWETTVSHIDEWLFDVCIPAMDKTLVSRETKSGLHCRFCPARQTQCPSIMSAMAEYQTLLNIAYRLTMRSKNVNLMTPEQLGRLLELNQIAKFVTKAAETAVKGMLSTGVAVPHMKLVKSRTNRKFKNGAEEAAVEKFGRKKAFTVPKFRTPAQLEELPEGKDFTARWAFKPEGGTTVAVEGDPRRAIKRSAKDLFKPVTRKRTKANG